MKKYSAIIITLTLFIGLFSASASSAALYEDRSLGLSVEFPAEWSYYTGSGPGPEYLKDLYKSLPEEANAIYIAGNENRQAYGRLISVEYGSSVSDYFEMIYAAQDDRIEVIRAQYDAINDVVQWEFRVKKGAAKATFIETIAKRQGRMVRIGFWTATFLVEKYRPVFERITEGIALLDNSRKWTKSWAGLHRNLEGADIEYVSTVAPVRSAAKTVCKKKTDGFFWTIKGPKGTAHIFGSIHMGKPDFYPLPPAVEAAFADAGTLALELDPTTDNFKKTLASYMATAKLPNNKTVKDVVSPGVYRNLAAAADNIGLPIEAISGLKPIMIAITISALKIQSLGYMPDYGVENYLLARKGNNKTVVELEGIDEQMKLFEQLGGETFLAYTLLSLDQMDRQVEKSIEAWRCGDTEAMKAMVFQDMNSSLLADNKEIFEKLFFERNRKMANRIKSYLQKNGSTFVVVGAGHLVGERSIPDLLRAEGFTVTGP